jgi:hypothetical protein
MVNREDVDTFCSLERKIEQRVVEVTKAYNEVRGWDASFTYPEFWIEDNKFSCAYIDKWRDNHTLTLDVKYLFMSNVKEVFRIEFEQYQARKREQEENRKRRELKDMEKGERKLLQELLNKYPEEAKRNGKE